MKILDRSPGISAAACRELQIFNTWHFALQGDQARRVPVVEYTSDVGRGGHGQFWAVSLSGLDLDGVDRDEGYESPYYVRTGGHFDGPAGTRRNFRLGDGATFAERKRAGRDAAVAWAAEHFDVEEWAREPFGAYLPAAFVEERAVELRLALREARKAATA